MNGEKNGTVVEPPREESRMGRYFRYLMVGITLIFFLVLAASMIMKKIGA